MGTTEDKMIGWHHRLDEHESEQAPGVGDGQGSLVESKRLFYTSGSLLLSRIQGYHYHLSKFHIYALVYCIGVFLSGLLHSV